MGIYTYLQVPSHSKEICLVMRTEEGGIKGRQTRLSGSIHVGKVMGRGSKCDNGGEIGLCRVNKDNCDLDDQSWRASFVCLSSLSFFFFFPSYYLSSSLPFSTPYQFVYFNLGLWERRSFGGGGQIQNSKKRGG